MNATLIVFGSVIPVFSLALVAAALVGVGVAARRTGWRAGALVDLTLAAGVGALVGGRAEHVALHWAAWFSAHPDEIARVALGGLGWHGAVVGGLIGLFAAARFVRLPVSTGGTALLDPFAPALALLALGGWIGCAAAPCAWGKEVTTLADYPAWAVGWTRDVYNLYAPRYNTQLFGAALAVLLLLAAAWLPRRVRAGHFWLILALLSAGMFFIGFWRADPVPVVFGLRADQVADAVTGGVSLAFYRLARR